MVGRDHLGSAAVPSRLRPTAPIAADAILVGDPGRALLLAQELLEQPKMSNHARGLWGYSGRTPAGNELTLQATGMGGPSAAIVLADLAELGVRRAIRIGTCAAIAPDLRSGETVVVEEAIAGGGSAGSFGVAPGAAVAPDPGLRDGLRRELGESAREAKVASFDAMTPGPEEGIAGAEAADMQTVAVLARARALEIAAAAVLIVAERGPGGEHLSAEELEQPIVAAGKAAASILSP
jgi:purine-nucleoside phosphorylase